MLQEPESLDENTFVLLICKRNVETRTYLDKAEYKYVFN